MSLTIGVIFGGRSVEHEVSIITGIQVSAVLDLLGYNLIPIYVAKNCKWYTGEKLKDIHSYKNVEKLLAKCEEVIPIVNDNSRSIVSKSSFNFFRSANQKKIDMMFPVIHGSYGEDGTLQGLLEIMNIPYVGCNVISSSICMDKDMFKKMLKSSSIPSLDYRAFLIDQWINNSNMVIDTIEKNIGYPCIIKPSRLGSSIGITKAVDIKTLRKAIDTAFSFDTKIIIEPYIANFREINCSLIGNHNDISISVFEEPVRHNSNILDYSDKYVNEESFKGMAASKRKIPLDNIPKDIKEYMEKIAKQCFSFLECTGLVRLDFIVKTPIAIESIYVNEINTIPGSLSFYLWEHTGKSSGDVVRELIDIAYENYRQKNNVTFSLDTNLLSNPSSIKLNK